MADPKDPNGESEHERRAREAMALLRDRETLALHRTVEAEARGPRYGASEAREGPAPTAEASPPTPAPEDEAVSDEPADWASPHWTTVGGPLDSLLPVPEPAPEVDDPRLETVDDPRIPAGTESFRIGEAARIVGVKPHVLRFWETEFEWVLPEKTETNQRRYTRSHVAQLLQIRRLRHDAGLTVAQTRASIEAARRHGGRPMSMVSAVPTTYPTAPSDAGHVRAKLEEMRRAVIELLEAVEES
ncbi:MAG: MerR family transcriptional regulator [Myxococcota bacterium]